LSTLPDHETNDSTRTYFQLAPDTIIGHYRIIEKIGAGGMGEVYLAEDTKLDRKVALKFLPQHLCQSSDCRARFTREAQATAKLSHPNIVTIFEVSDFNGRPFFAMEHVEGQTLKEVIAGKPLPLERVVEIGIQVCEGLQAAHEKGITHRDIKPANILIDSHGRARIVDFGLASVLGTDQLTKTGSTLGTIGYMSPEQVRGEKVDHRTDLFSLGVVLYEMIAGHSPFKADSEAATLRHVLDTVPEPLARYRSGVPAELDRIVFKALAKERGHRYQHADELSADLGALDQSVNQLHGSRGGKGRRAVSVGLALVILVALVIIRPWRFLDLHRSEVVPSHECVVIVPFRNLTGDPSLDALGKMVADWTSQSLLPTGLAEVVPTEKLPRRTEEMSVRSIVDSTGATIIVAGSYYKIGDSVQFQAQVINDQERFLQAIDPINCGSSRIMEGVEIVRQKLLGAVALALDERLTGTSLQQAKPPTFAAYQEYMQAREIARTDFDWVAAAGRYRHAYAMDTTFLEALLRACGSCFNANEYNRMDSLVQFLEVRRSRLSVLQQLKLDEWQAQLSGDGMMALESMRKASQLAPGYVYEWGYWAFRMNRLEECITALKRIDPTKGSMRDWMPYWVYLGASYHLLGKLDDEMAVVRQGRLLHPTNALLLDNEIRALAGRGEVAELNKRFVEMATLPSRGGFDLGREMRTAGAELRAHGYELPAMECFRQAIAWYEGRAPEKRATQRFEYAQALYLARRWSDAGSLYTELAKDTPTDPDLQGWLALVAAHTGDRSEAIRISDWLRDQKGPYQFGTLSYIRACIAAVLGDKEQAVQLLRESLEQGNYFNINYHRNVDFESLHEYPPFQELLRSKE
jgi:predicted Ser/Thr protein kinase